MKNRIYQRACALLIAYVVAGIALTGCGQSGQNDSTPSPSSSLVKSGLLGSYEEEDYLTDSPSNATKIVLSGDSVSVEGSGATVEGTIITIQSPGDYHISGNLSDGQLIVAAEKEDRVHVILDNASITNSTSSPFYVKQCDKLILTLAEKSENSLTDGEDYAFPEGEDEPDATLFSKDDLTINGTGALTVSANYRNGITSKNDIAIISGQITVTAVNDALRGKDSVSILDGDLTLTATNDGIKSNNDQEADKGTITIDGGTILITAGSDGIQAETVLTIAEGDVSITAGGGSVIATSGSGMQDRINVRSDRENGTAPESFAREMPDASAPPTTTEAASVLSAKGIKAGTALTIHGGTFALDCLDDALHSNGDLTINGGTFSITTDDDGLHAASLNTINDGFIEILRSYEGIEGNAVVINDGEIRLTARDDGINAAGDSDQNVGIDRFSGKDGCDITINGGLIVVTASGDGIDANGAIAQNGGTLLVNGPTSGGNGALDYDREYKMNGGTLAASGSAGMPQATSSSSMQPSLYVKFSSVQEMGTAVNLTGEDGTLILSFAPSKPFETLVLSSPNLVFNESYTLSANSEGNGGADGITQSVELLGDTLCSVTLTEPCTTINSDGSPATAITMGGHGGERNRGNMMEGNRSGEPIGQHRAGMTRPEHVPTT